MAKKRFCRSGRPENGKTGVDLRCRYVRLKNWENESFFIADSGRETMYRTGEDAYRIICLGCREFFLSTRFVDVDQIMGDAEVAADFLRHKLRVEGAGRGAIC